ACVLPENPASYRVVRTKSYLFNKAALSLKLVSAPDYLRSVQWHYIFQAQAFRYNDKNWLLYTPPRKLMSLLVYNQEAFFFYQHKIFHF
ncbi:hypothetical protein, partial [Enterobacter roggenkampii]|uniref:hypothetical protein n=1 Tax=Enterobacter roggenkampii TaxID=1812935 RepID=UPI0020756B15